MNRLSMLWMMLAQQDPCSSGEENWQEVVLESVQYEFQGNEIWRFLLLLLIILISLVAGKITSYFLDKSSKRLCKSVRAHGHLTGMLLRTMVKPVVFGCFALGLYVGRWTIHFSAEGGSGFSTNVEVMWAKISLALIATAITYWLYNLIDILEYYLLNITKRTKTPLDDMLVPMLRKSVRIFLIILAILYIADGILGWNLKTIIAAAGIGGLAFALAAKDTISNLFGSVNIFADRPFQVGERIEVNGYDGVVEEVGFRSTRIRTLDGHLVSIPNSTIANESIKNIGRRPYIKRVLNVSITYDTPAEKIERAVAIIKEILAEVPEVNSDPELPPRVYFNDYQSFYLNILVIYWYKPAEYWPYLEAGEKINLALKRAYDAEGIDFAFPTQTLYLRNEKGWDGAEG